MLRLFVVVIGVAASIGSGAFTTAQEDPQDGAIRQSFRSEVRPFLEKYCLSCHGEAKQEAKLNFSGYRNVEAVTSDMGHWEIILRRLVDKDMPPEDAPVQVDPKQRQLVIQWITAMRRSEANRNAGDPGPVLARRLSNAEYDYTIHDLTGVDIRPTREFPIDPANEAGFANSGESLSMSPALLQKYLDAARYVADHLVFTPKGLDFAPHPVVTESDRDKYCVHRIVDFYKRQPVDYADYFLAAWKYKHDRDRTLPEVARAEGVSPKYLSVIWDTLHDTADDAGPLARLRRIWQQLPDSVEHMDQVRSSCKEMVTS